MRKKIVIVISHLGLGGAERVTTILANYLVNLDYDVSVVVFSSKYCEYDLDKRIDKIQLPEWKGKCKNIAGQIYAYRKLLKKLHPNYVIALTMYRYIILSMTINKYRYILSERNDPENYSSEDVFIHKFLFKRAKAVVFQTPDAKSFYQGIANDNSKVIPNPIKENLPDPSVETREKRIVAFSRLTKQKNIPLLLKAFKKLSYNYPEYILEIYGVGDNEDELKQISEELHISDKVHFMGYTADIHEKIKNATMFISSSDYEGISNSMIEAMAMGLPVICTDCPCGGARMVIKDKINGLLIAVGDEEALVEKMKYIIENPQIASSMGKEAIKIRESLSADKIVLEWECLLQ